MNVYRRKVFELGDFQLFFDQDWEEFQIIVKGEKEPRYFTSDEVDAVDTIRSMAGGR